MKNFFHIQSIENFKNHSLIAVVILYLGLSIPVILYNFYKDMNTAEQLLMRHISNDISLNDFRFAEQKYLAVCKIINIDRLVVTTNSSKLDIDCGEKGIFTYPIEVEFNKNKFRIMFGIDNYIFYLSLNAVICFLLALLALLYRKIETQKRKVVELQKNQLIHKKLVYEQVAHDIRSPLSVLNMLIPALVNESSEKLELVEQAVARINSIAEDLLTKGRSASSHRRIDVVSVVKNIIAEKVLSTKDKVTIKFQHSNVGLDCFIEIEETVLSRIISNLLNNAIEAFSAGSGRVDIKLETMENGLFLVITDNGKGIPESVISNIGTKGFSYGKSEISNAGSGLGVYYCKSTIEKAGGSFDINSRQGCGTTVEITLPFAN